MTGCLIRKIIFGVLLVTCLFFPLQVFAQDEISRENTILITKSDFMKDVKFDGKWSFLTEWKPTSWDTIRDHDKISFHLRSAHQDNFIYFLIDVTIDEKFNQDDKATICFDTQNNKSLTFDDNDFCFIIMLKEESFFNAIFLEGKNKIVQGNTDKNSFDELQEISVKEFVGIGTMSDEEDRYSKIPHASYEFKIPTDLVGRSDNYGFFVSVYDADLENTYTWPENVQSEEQIPNPSKWGNLVSPDKSLPEFEFVILMILTGFAATILFSRAKLGKIFPN
jgi:hypothetical protein